MRALTWLLILVLGVLLSCIAGRARADAIARHGADWVQLTEAPCTDAAVVSKITEAGQDASDYRAASAEFNGQHFSACWRLLPGQPYAYMRYEDGDAGLIPFADLQPLKQT